MPRLQRVLFLLPYLSPPLPSRQGRVGLALGPIPSPLLGTFNQYRDELRFDEGEYVFPRESKFHL